MAREGKFGKRRLIAAAAAVGLLLAIGLVSWRYWTATVKSLPRLASAGSTSRAASQGSIPPSKAKGNEPWQYPIESPKSLSTTEWVARFRASSNLFSYVTEALPLAEAGDGYAQFFVGQAVQSCKGTALLYRKFTDPVAKFEERQREILGPHIAAGDTGALVALDDRRREFERCKRFIHEDPFSELPTRVGGYPAEYWFEQAQNSGNALARVRRVGEELRREGTATSGSDVSAISAQALVDLRDAILTRDPVAINAVAAILSSPRVGGGGDAAVALMILACQEGLDCSAKASVNSGVCLRLGTCTEGETTLDRIKADLGMARYAEIDAKAQQFLDAIERHDAASVTTLLDVRRARAAFPDS